MGAVHETYGGTEGQVTRSQNVSFQWLKMSLKSQDSPKIVIFP